MQIAMVGLGRMGGNMVRRLTRAGHEVVALDRSPEVTHAVEGEHDLVTGARDLEDLVARLRPPRVVWVMVPAGKPTEQTVHELFRLLEPGDIVVNGGNCRWTDSMALAEAGAAAGVAHLDAGVSGGIWGLEEGYCLMVGGDEAACTAVEQVFTALAPADGYARVGEAGAGHFAKMVHNGIEYALMQSYAEGFELLDASDFGYDLTQVADVWRRGSVVRSWLLDLTAAALAEHGDLRDIAPYVEDSGEGRWTVEAAISHRVPAPAISAALFARFASRRLSFADRLIAVLRGQFGGHEVRRIER